MMFLKVVGVTDKPLIHSQVSQRSLGNKGPRRELSCEEHLGVLYWLE